MALAGLAIDFFLERIADMPDIEALHEIDLRLVRMSEDRRSMRGGQGLKDVMDRLAVMNDDEVRLRSERHLIVMRMDRKKWSKAVRAIWGQEGLEQCLVWMETMGEPELKQVPIQPKGRM